MNGGHKIKGDLVVSRQLESLRSNEALFAQILAANISLDGFCEAWQSIDGAGVNRVVELPSALTIAKGWKVVVHNTSSAAEVMTVKSYDGSFTGATLKAIAAPEAANDTLAYQFICVDNSTAAGVWYVVELGESATLVAARYVATFVVADWPATVGGLKTLTSTQVAGLGAAIHGRGVTPLFMVQEKVSANYDRVTCHIERTDASGNMALTVTKNDAFDGRVILI